MTRKVPMRLEVRSVILEQAYVRDELARLAEANLVRKEKVVAL